MSEAVKNIDEIAKEIKAKNAKFEKVESSFSASNFGFEVITGVAGVAVAIIAEFPEPAKHMQAVAIAVGITAVVCLLAKYSNMKKQSKIKKELSDLQVDLILAQGNNQ